MAPDLFGRRFREQNRGDGGEGGGGAPRRTPAEINQDRNNSRLAMIERVSQTADGRRAEELEDTDGQRVTGRFDGGSFDDSSEARERAAQREEELAEQARQEQEDRAREAEEREGEDAAAARRLQEEGGDEGARQRREEPRGEANEAGDEKVVDGVKYYATIVDGAEKWLTLRQLREHAAVVINTEETLQRAQDALQRSSPGAPSPKDVPPEVDDKDLENIILSAAVGDEEAVRKLVQVIKARPAGINQQDIGRQVTQQIATQRAIDDAKSEQKDLLGNAVLSPIFDQRLVAFAREKPKTTIRDAYKAVGEQMRKDFAPLLTTDKTRTQTTADRKRTIVTPPQGVARQRTSDGDDREPSVSQDIDAIAKTRGQQRAHRERRQS